MAKGGDELGDSMPVQQWPIDRYWCEDSKLVRQCWYVSFCLLMSSIQDRLTGIALRESGNLNWAVMAHYYSGVHAGRLLCFAAFGDYPTGHSDLAKLLAQPNRDVGLNWLHKLLWRIRPGDTHYIEQVKSPNAEFERLVERIPISGGADSETVKQLGAQLERLRKLRNDCTYETLIAVHERDHIHVEEGFQSLLGSADHVSLSAIKLGIDAYMGVKTKLSDLDERQHTIKEAHDYFLTLRLHDSLRAKFGKCKAALDELKHVTTTLKIPADRKTAIVAGERNTGLNAINIESFHMKRGLMGCWCEDVMALTSCVNGEDE